MTERLGKYSLVTRLGKGGMGELFVARAQGPAGFQKTVALKRILPHLASDPTFVEMFLNEARLAAMLSHRNLVQLFELGEEAGTYFIAMEFLHGRNLRAVAAKARSTGQRVPFALAARIGGEALRGLHYAHQLQDGDARPLQLVHRDVTPDNVLVGFDGAVKVVDFGIAKALGTPATRTGPMKGTCAFMAPEQIRNEPLTPRIDVYAVGVVLYELIAGVRPFSAPNEIALIHQVLSTRPVPLHERVPDVPRPLADAVMRAMAPQPENRFESAEAMAAALEETAGSVGAAQLSEWMRALFGSEAADDPRTVEEGGTRTVPGVKARSSTPAEGPRRPLPWGFLWLGLATGLVAMGGVLASRGLRTPAPSAHIEALPPPEPKPADVVPPAVEPPPPPAREPAPVAAPVTPAKREPPRPARPPATTRVKKPAAPGRVVFQITPWAEVFHAGKAIGLTPLPPLSVGAGEQEFTLVNEDLKVRRKVTVRVPPGGQAILKADLFREP